MTSSAAERHALTPSIDSTKRLHECRGSRCNRCDEKFTDDSLRLSGRPCIVDITEAKARLHYCVVCTVVMAFNMEQTLKPQGYGVNIRGIPLDQHSASLLVEWITGDPGEENSIDVVKLCVIVIP